MQPTLCPCLSTAEIAAADFGHIAVDWHSSKSAGIEPLGVQFGDVLVDAERGGAFPGVFNFVRCALTKIGQIEALALVNA